jgi:rhamnopyranosyl-N-acetylglucosaminyl-diphospho-decaprenol beta-1,3/1,4-galactofuranosyltransferase
LRQTRPLDEIIVVDNASTDGTREMVERRFPAGVTCLRLDENLGGAAGFDHGMRLAHQRGHDWIWCLDSDALPGESTLEDLLSAPYESPVPVVARTCVLRDPASGRIYPGGWRGDRDPYGQTAPFERSTWEGKILSVDFGTLCCLLVKAEAVRRVGFVRADLFIYFDEAFLSKALKSAGEIIQVGTKIVAHSQSEQRLEMRHGRLRWAAREYWRTYYLFRNEFLFDRYCSGVRRAAGKFIYTYLHRLAGILAHDDNKAYRMKILTRAFCDGLLGRTGKRVDPQEFQSWCRRQTAGA